MTSFAILLALIAFSPMQTMAKEPSGGGAAGGGGKGGGGKGGGEVHANAGVASHSAGTHVDSGKQGSDHHVGVGGNAAVNQAVRSNKGTIAGQAAKPHQVFDAHQRPDFSGGKGEGRDSWRYRWDNDRWWFYGPDNRWMLYGDDGQWQYYSTEYVVRRPILENVSGGPIQIVNPVKAGTTLNYTLDGNAFTIPPGYSQELQADRAWVIEFSRGTNLDQARYGLETGVYTFTSTDHGWELYHSAFPQTVTLPPPKAAPTNPSQQ